MAPPPGDRDLAARALAVAQGAPTAALATIAREPAGTPFGSLVAFALDGPDAVLLLSGLAEHTGNLRADPRASLLVVEGAAEGDPLAHGRVTLLGQAAVVAPADTARCRDLFLMRHPAAAAYVGFRDFAFWRLTVTEVRFVAGFGRMGWIDAAAWRAAAG